MAFQQRLYDKEKAEEVVNLHQVCSNQGQEQEQEQEQELEEK